MMRNNSKKIIKNTAFLYIRMLFLMFVSLFTSRITLQNLGVTDFGIYNIVGGVTSLLVFFRSSLANATQRYLSIELGKNDTEGVISVFRQHQTLYIFIAIIVLILSETIGLWFVCHKLVIPPERVNASVWVYQFTVFSSCLTILSIVYDAAIIAHEDMHIYSYTGIVEGMAKLTIAYVLAFIPSDRLTTYALLFFLQTLCLWIFYVSICKRRYDECRYRFSWNAKSTKEICSFIGWNTVGTLVYFLNGQGINILLNLFFGPAVNAARGISYQVSGAISSFSTNFYTAVRPRIMKAYAAGEFRQVLFLFFRSSKYSVFLLWLFCLPVMLCIDQILAIWLTCVPEYTSAFTVWVLAHSMIYVLDNPMWTIVLATGKLKRYVLAGNSILVLAFLFSYICLKNRCSPVSVFQILFAIRIVYIGAALFVIRRYIYFPMEQYFVQVIRPSIGVIGSSGGVCLLLSKWFQPTMTGYAMLCCVCILSTLCLTWLLGMTGEERGIFRKRARTALQAISRNRISRT